jgi:hypothetical protein
LSVIGLLGSYFSLASNDWWLNNVSNYSIVSSFYLFQFSYTIFALFILFQKMSIQNIDIIANDGVEKVIFPIVIIICILISVIFIFPTSALRELIYDPSVDAFVLAEMRGSMGINNPNLNKFIVYFQNIILRYFLPFVTAFYAIRYFRRRVDAKWMYSSFCALIFTSSLTLAKAPVVSCFIILFIVAILFSNVDFKKIGKYFFIVFGVLIALYAIIMDINYRNIVPAILHRLFLAQYLGFPIVVDVFPNQHQFLGLSGISGSISYLLDIEYKSFSRIAMEYANPYGVEKGVAGYMSTIFFAEGYAMGGIYVLFISFFIVLIFFQWLDLKFKKINSELVCALYVLFLYKIPFLIGDGFISIVVNYGLIFCVLIVLVLNSYNRKHKAFIS